MDRTQQRAEVDQNFDAFQRNLSLYLAEQQGRFALMHNGAVVAFFERPAQAYADGRRRFDNAPFSIQEVTDEPIDLGSIRMLELSWRHDRHRVFFLS